MARQPLSCLVALVAVTTLAACPSQDGSESPAAGEWVSETSTVGDVTTVRTISGSIWGGEATLEEELSIGVESGEDAYMFGNVGAVAQHGDEIFVLDRQVPTVRVYDLSGRHLRDLGKEGQGPGELSSPETMATGPDGRVYLRDPRNGRIMILSPQGEETGTIAIRSNYVTSAPMVVTPDGTLYNSQRLDSGIDITDSVTGFAPLFEDESRTGEPVAPPDFGYESPSLVARQGGGVSISMVPYAPRVIWTLSPSGARIAGISDDYSFDVQHPGGSVTRVTKSWDPILVEPDEADWQRRLATARMRRNQSDWTWNGPPIPGQKPAYTRFLPDHAGRIWVNRPGPSHRVGVNCVENPDLENLRQASAQPCWRAGSTWEVFDEEGRFMGGAQIPENVQTFSNPYITEDYFLASFMDELGTVMVKRFRIVRPAS